MEPEPEPDEPEPDEPEPEPEFDDLEQNDPFTGSIIQS